MKKTIWKNPNNFNELEVNENCLIDNRTGEQFIKDENYSIYSKRGNRWFK